jgi:hypothetical protein
MQRARDGASGDEQPQAPAAAAPPSRLRLDQAVQVDRSVQIFDVPVLSGAFIRCAPALSHPRLEHPVAYFSGIALAPLLREADSAATADQILKLWTRSIPPEAAWNIMTWMWAVGILVPHPDTRHDRIAAAQARNM